MLFLEMAVSSNNITREVRITVSRQQWYFPVSTGTNATNLQLQRRWKLWSNGSTSLDRRLETGVLNTTRQSLDYHAHQK